MVRLRPKQLVITEQNPIAGDQNLTLTLSGAVLRGMSWWECWKPIILSIAAALFAIFVILGFVLPKSFSTYAGIVLSGSEMGLRKAPTRQLREQTGGRKRWYRSAKVTFDQQGNALKSRKSAQLILEAQVGTNYGYCPRYRTAGHPYPQMGARGPCRRWPLCDPRQALPKRESLL